MVLLRALKDSGSRKKDVTEIRISLKSWSISSGSFFRTRKYFPSSLTCSSLMRLWMRRLRVPGL